MLALWEGQEQRRAESRGVHRSSWCPLALRWVDFQWSQFGKVCGSFWWGKNTLFFSGEQFLLTWASWEDGQCFCHWVQSLACGAPGDPERPVLCYHISIQQKPRILYVSSPFQSHPVLWCFKAFVCERGSMKKRSLMLANNKQTFSFCTCNIKVLLLFFVFPP